jgi:ABC-type Zn uptake system ZnuABC Zn-binding protein ZnuA
LDDEVAAIMAEVPEDRRYMLTNHLTFGYFAARYGLTLVGVIIPGGSTTAEPSTQDVLALIDTINEYGLPAIFTENVVSDSLAGQIADETGAVMVRLYTESLSEPGAGAETYLDYLRYNATAIAGALK